MAEKIAVLRMDIELLKMLGEVKCEENFSQWIANSISYAVL
jgi:hypothetical protein